MQTQCTQFFSTLLMFTIRSTIVEIVSMLSKQNTVQCLTSSIQYIPLPQNESSPLRGFSSNMVQHQGKQCLGKSAASRQGTIAKPATPVTHRSAFLLQSLSKCSWTYSATKRLRRPHLKSESFTVGNMLCKYLAPLNMSQRYKCNKCSFWQRYGCSFEWKYGLKDRCLSLEVELRNVNDQAVSLECRWQLLRWASVRERNI